MGSVSGSALSKQGATWKFTSQHGEEFRDGQGGRLEEAEVYSAPPDLILVLTCLTCSARSAQFRGTSQSCLSRTEEGLQLVPPGLSSAPCDPRDHFSYESTVSLSCSIDWALDKPTQEKSVP